MKLCEMVQTDKCVFHEASIPYPPSVESLEDVVRLIGECPLVEGLEGAKCPFVEWVAAQGEQPEQPADSEEGEDEDHGESTTIEDVSATIEGATTLSDLMAIEADIAMTMEGVEDKQPWAEKLADLRGKMEEVAKAEGLEEISDTFADKPSVTESEDGRLLVTGAFARVNVPTRNHRVYPQSLWDANEEHIKRALESTKLVGQDNHPAWGGTILSEINIIFKKIWQDGDVMRYEGIVPRTRAGKDLEELINLGVGIELSTRGYGSVESGEWEGEECMIVQDDYRLHAIDVLMDGAALGTSMAPKKGNSEAHTESIEESKQPPTKERTTMRNRVIKMLEQAIRTAGVLGLTDVIETLQANLDAVKAIEADGEGLEAALDEATQALDEATVAFETSKADEGKDDLDEKIARFEALEARLDAREAAEKVKEARDAKVEALMTEAEGLNEKYAARLRTSISACESADEAASLFAALLPVMQEASEIADKESVAIHTRGSNESAALTGERRERPKTVREVKEQLIEGLCNDTGWANTSNVPVEDLDPGDHVRNFRILMDNYEREYPSYFSSLTAEGFARHRMFVESTTTSDVAVGAPFILPIIRRTYPKLVALELCSVQPMDRPDGKVFWLNAKTDSGGARLDVESNFDSTYADHTESNASAKVKMEITSASIAAVSKSLEGTWTTELAQDLQAYHNLNAESEILGIASEEIASEINFTILEDMRANATGSTARTFGTAIPTSSNYTGREWNQRLVDFLMRVGGDIADKVYRRPNWIVCDPTTASRFSVLNTFVAAAPDEQNAFTVDVIYEGTMSNRWKVYSVGWFTDNTVLMGYKGADWKDVGYIFAPYVLAYLSPAAYNTSTLTASRATMSRYATYMANANMFGRLAIQPGVAGTELT